MTTCPLWRSRYAQQGELAGREIDHLVADARHVARFVQLELARPQAARGLGRGPPAEGPHAGEQLGEGERLGQVVVGPGVEPGDPLLDRAEGREQEHRGLHAAGAHQPQHLEAVQVGQHAVQDHDVVGRAVGEGERADAVAGHVHHVVLSGQDAPHEGGHPGFVFDQQQAHRADARGGQEARSRAEGPVMGVVQ